MYFCNLEAVQTLRRIITWRQERIRNRRAAERAAKAAETSTTHSVPLPPSKACSGCGKQRPVTDFSLKIPQSDADGEKYRVCGPCTVHSHTVPPHPEQLDEQDADEQDDRLPPASPDSSAGDSLPREDSGRRLTLCAYTILLRKKNNTILLTCVWCKVRGKRLRRRSARRMWHYHPSDRLRRARQSRARANANCAAADRRRTAGVEEALAAALRTPGNERIRRGRLKLKLRPRAARRAVAVSPSHNRRDENHRREWRPALTVWMNSK
ncbi:hypothetical protein E4U30_003475 [Claviceps sp. LM220 group G6]|nr:hypothetical protein E4U30_003475 [Claviceps sp. LM220 group G6]